MIREKRRGRMFNIVTGTTHKNAIETHAEAVQQWFTIIDKTVDLFTRLRTRQAEIAATVMYVMDELAEAGRQDIEEYDVLRKVIEWKQNRKPPITVGEVADAIRNLAALSWIDVKPNRNLPVTELY